MSENPDNKDYLGDAAYLTPSAGMLRFVERGVPTENPEVMKKARILQVYEWSSSLRKHDWFDVQFWSEGDG